MLIGYRYVLKHKDEAKGIDEALIVIVLTLVPEDELEAEEKRWATSGAADARSEKSSAPKKEETAKPEQKTFADEDVD